MLWNYVLAGLLCASVGLQSVSTCVGAEETEHISSDWPQFRGVQASGVGSGSPPAAWDIETGKNVLWKSPIAGLGHACPITFGNRVFIATAVSAANEESLSTGAVGGAGESAVESGDWQWQLVCLDLTSGKEVWKRTLHTGPPTIRRHIKSTHANSTPVTDGRRVVAFFGSEGLYCLDMNGEVLWKKDLGRLHSGPYDAPDLEWGFASSPVIHEDRLILQCDCLNTGFVSILNLADGEEVRRIERKDVATWSTPLILKTETETQLICNGYRQMAGYNLETGEQLWTLHDGGDVPVPAPLIAHDRIYITNGHGRSPLYAIDPSARGDITPRLTAGALPDGLAWWQPHGGAYISTPVIVGDFLYSCSTYGVLSVRDAHTGELVNRQRLGGWYSASAVASQQHVYLCSESGQVSTIRAGDNFERIATTDMHEPVFATPAIADDRLLIRTQHHLYSIAETEPSE